MIPNLGHQYYVFSKDYQLRAPRLISRLQKLKGNNSDENADTVADVLRDIAKLQVEREAHGIKCTDLQHKVTHVCFWICSPFTRMHSTS